MELNCTVAGRVHVLVMCNQQVGLSRSILLENSAHVTGFLARDLLQYPAAQR